MRCLLELCPNMSYKLLLLGVIHGWNFYMFTIHDNRGYHFVAQELTLDITSWGQKTYYWKIRLSSTLSSFFSCYMGCLELYYHSLMSCHCFQILIGIKILTCPLYRSIWEPHLRNALNFRLQILKRRYTIQWLFESQWGPLIFAVFLALIHVATSKRKNYLCYSFHWKLAPM